MNKRFLASNIIGPITDPWRTLNPNYPTEGGAGLITLFNNLLKLVVVAAGIWAFINIIVAGYNFMAGAGNPEKIAEANNKIWQSLIGLLIVAGAFALAAIFGYLIFNNPMAIISPTIYGPS
jgi:hypothetical protein